MTTQIAQPRRGRMRFPAPSGDQAAARSESPPVRQTSLAVFVDPIAAMSYWALEGRLRFEKAMNVPAMPETQAV